MGCNCKINSIESLKLKKIELKLMEVKLSKVSNPSEKKIENDF